MKTILAVTGIRSEYDIMSSVFKAINDHPNLNLKIVVTGAHLSQAYGMTLHEIENDGFIIEDKVESLINADSESSRIKGLGIQIQGLVQTVSRVKPDILLVLGDREESISTALVGSYMNIPVAHICGGDRVVGNVDDQIRHAVTKLSHIHFASNIESAERILKLGEQPFRVFNVGNPGIDRLIDTPKLSKPKLFEKLGVSFCETKPLLVVIQHVISTEVDYAYEQMEQTLNAINELKINCVLIYPNSDAGSQEIIRCIQDFSISEHIHVAKNLPRIAFVNMLRHASCLIGNSSAGILEAPALKIPVVNVGNRQKGRLSSENVCFVEHDKNAIIDSINDALYNQSRIEEVKNCVNPYGDGTSSSKIAKVLNEVELNNDFLIKDITY